MSARDVQLARQGGDAPGRRIDKDGRLQDGAVDSRTARDEDGAIEEPGRDMAVPRLGQERHHRGRTGGRVEHLDVGRYEAVRCHPAGDQHAAVLEQRGGMTRPGAGQRPRCDHRVRDGIVDGRTVRKSAIRQRPSDNQRLVVRQGHDGAVGQRGAHRADRHPCADCLRRLRQQRSRCRGAQDRQRRPCAEASCRHVARRDNRLRSRFDRVERHHLRLHAPTHS